MPIPIGRTPSVSTASLTSSAKAWAEGFNFGSATAVRRLDVPRTQAPTTGPEPVQRAYALYKSWEDNDLGSVRLLKTSVGTQTVYALHTTTDGDDGYLELFNAQGKLLSSGTTGFDQAGKRNVTWDATAGAVREQVAPKDRSPSIEAFFSSIAAAKKSTSASGATLTVQELRDATKNLVGEELTTSSVDGFENAALLRVLADAPSKLTSSSRGYGEQLAQLYGDSNANSLSKLTKRALGTGSAWTKKAELASAAVSAAGAAPGMAAMTALSQRTWNQLPAQVVPLTRTEAQKVLRDSGASAAEAKAAVDALADAKGTIYGGRSFEQGLDWVPKTRGVALFGVSPDGRALKALNVPAVSSAPTGAVPRDVIKNLLGVDREVEISGRQAVAGGERFDLRWRPPSGGVIEAKLTVPSNGDEATLSGVTLPPPLEPSLAQNLEGRLKTVLGTDRKVIGWVGRDDAQGVAFVVAHQPAAGGPATLSTVRIAMGGASATVTPRPLGTGDVALARDLAAVIARGYAPTLVSDPSIPAGAKLEVALRTAWTQPADLVVPDPRDSAVGFDAATERAQFMLGNVWGDNAVFVTFGKNGSVRVEDFN